MKVVLKTLLPAAYLDILPALPSTCTHVMVSGLKGSGAFEVSMEWKKVTLENLEIKSLKGNMLNVRYRVGVISIDTRAGES